MVVLMELTQKSWGYSWELSCNQSHGWTITLVVRWFSQLFSAQWENSIHSFPCLMIPEAIAKDRGYSSFCLLDKPISTAHGKTRMSNLKFAFASVFLSSFTPIFCDIFPDRIKTIAIPHLFYWIILHFFFHDSFPKKITLSFTAICFSLRASSKAVAARLASLCGGTALARRLGLGGSAGRSDRKGQVSCEEDPTEDAVRQWPGGGCGSEWAVKWLSYNELYIYIVCIYIYRV